MYDNLSYRATAKCFSTSLENPCFSTSFVAASTHHAITLSLADVGHSAAKRVRYPSASLTPLCAPRPLSSPTAPKPSLPERGCGVGGSMDQSMNGAASNEQRSMLSTWWLIRVSRFVEPPHRFITTVASFRDCVREEANPNGVPNRA